MEWTYDKIAKWFDGYFEDVCKYQGSLETVPNLKKYFSSEMELTMYTAPSSPPPVSMSRDELLISFVHPGLQEDIAPEHYAIDVKKMIVAVQFKIRFTDKPSGTKWQPVQASAHYHLSVDENRDLKITKIFYWTEKLPEDLFGFWAAHRERAFRHCALGYINSKP
jgi:hypothetical protein